MWINPEANLKSLHIPLSLFPPCPSSSPTEIPTSPLNDRSFAPSSHQREFGGMSEQQLHNSHFPVGHPITLKTFWCFLEWNCKNAQQRIFLLIVNHFTVMVEWDLGLFLNISEAVLRRE